MSVTIGDEAYLYWDQYVVKAAEVGMQFSWHQDSAFNTTAPHRPYVSIWCALDDMTEEPKVCLVLLESLVVDAPWVVEALARALPEGVVILGGASARSDFTTMTPTYQFRNDAVATDGVAIMVFGGPISYSAAVGMGFKTIGAKGTVTRAEPGALQEIDGRPATEFLNRYVDATGPAAYSNPLAVFEDGEAFYLRAIRPSEAGSSSNRPARFSFDNSFSCTALFPPVATTL